MKYKFVGDEKMKKLRLRVCVSVHVLSLIQLCVIPGTAALQIRLRVCISVRVLSHVQSCVIPGTAALQTSLSMDFPDKNTGVGYHFLLQRIFPTQGTYQYSSPASPALAGGFFTTPP